MGSVSADRRSSGDAQQIQTTSTQLGTTIESNQILAMPLNGRSYIDLLSLQAGVAPVNTNSGFNDRSPLPASTRQRATFRPMVSRNMPTPSW